MDAILHITTRAAWDSAQASGFYEADSLATEGFIHCSTLAQLRHTANRYYQGQTGLVVLVIAPEKLLPELYYEKPTRGGEEWFPHIYGPLNVDAVMDVHPIQPAADGSYNHLDLAL